MNNKMIGLSVSFCVKAMAKGEVDPAQVEKIVGATSCRSDEDWNRAIDVYRKCYWYGVEDIAEKIIRQFISEGRIEQPRLIDDEKFPSIRESIWVNSADQIVWWSEK
jgi:hypothetical protein